MSKEVKNNNSSVVETLINEIHNGLTQVSSSRKDEIRVMQAMLSDPSYQVTIYDKDGTGVMNPTNEFRSMCSNIMSNVANIPVEEARSLMDGYQLKRSDAEAMVDISKEFVNAYLHTGRKLPFGGREKSDISISLKEVEKSVRSYPTKVGVNDDGTDKYSKVPISIPAHETIKVHSRCPVWLENK